MKLVPFLELTQQQQDEFFEECAKREWDNNTSIEAMKIHSGDFNVCRFDALVEDGKVFCVSGIHDNCIIDGKEYWRALFRSATIPGIVKNNMSKRPQSFLLSHITPVQIKWAQELFDATDFIFTSNYVPPGVKDKAGMSARTGPIMARQPFITKTDVAELYGYQQNIHHVNIEEYFKHYVVL